HLLDCIMGKGNSKMSQDQIKQLAKQTYFTDKEIKQWYKGFVRDCPNGMLTEAGFQKIYKQFFPKGIHLISRPSSSRSSMKIKMEQSNFMSSFEHFLSHPGESRRKIAMGIPSIRRGQ
ncbi:hypothetical protein PENTCL1PPCAC_26710, partial [Pristionchus entomophagus]